MKLEPTEAQRKAMAYYLSFNVDEVIGLYEVDAMIAAANSIPEGPPVGTIARRPDGAVIAVRGEKFGHPFWTYKWLDDGPNVPTVKDTNDADSWPQIRPDEWPDQAGLDWFPPGEEPLVPRPDPTAQQEPTTTHPVSPESTNCVPKPRTPRVVDRLGVDEQGSRWRNCAGLEFWHDGTRWVSGGLGDDLYGDAYEPDALPPYTEKLEPRVLPSLDCEEARDGTAWQAAFSQTDHSRGWKFWYVPAEREWHTDAGHDGSSPLRTLDFLTERGPYTEVLGDPS